MFETSKYYTWYDPAGHFQHPREGADQGSQTTPRQINFLLGKYTPWVFIVLWVQLPLRSLISTELCVLTQSAFRAEGLEKYRT